jgi:hypothetical protein
MRGYLREADRARELIRMRRFLSAIIAAGAAAALAAGPASALAAATTTWTVTPGGAFTNPFPRQTRLHDLASGGKNYACQPVKMTGTFKAGSGLTDPIGRIGSVRGPQAKAIVCDLPGIAFLMTFTHFPMNINARHYDAATGVTRGVITGVHITLSTAPGKAPCTGVIDGTGPSADNGKIPFTFTNTGVVNGELDFAQVLINLTAYNVSGCNGQIHSGDNFIYQVMAFPRTSTGAADTITSP